MIAVPSQGRAAERGPALTAGADAADPKEDALARNTNRPH
jgi:hypothetical protein